MKRLLFLFLFPICAFGQITVSPSGAGGVGGGSIATDTIWDALGDTAYGSGADTALKLAGNITATRKFLRQTGNGSVSAAPAWDTLVAGDIPDISATYAPTTRTVTIAGTANEITSSAGAQDFTSNRTWTLSLPAALTFTGKTITGGTFSTPTLTTPVINGTPTGTGVDSVATASTLILRDASANSNANNFIPTFRTQATAAGTTTLVVGDAYVQTFTGVTTQNCDLPVVTTLPKTGFAFDIKNQSTGAVTVRSSGGNTVVVMAGNTEAIVTCQLLTGTTAASWSVDYGAVNMPSGAAWTIAGPTTARTVTAPDANFTIARTDAANAFIGASTASSWVLTSPTITTGITPTSNDGAALGSGSFMFSDLFLASGGVANWNNGSFTLTGGTNTLTASGSGANGNSFILPAGGTSLAPLQFTSGTDLTTPVAGAVEFDGANFKHTANTTNGRMIDDAWQFFRLTGSGTGITTIADFFGATGSGIALVSGGVYEIEWHCYFSQATAGTATWTIVTATTALANLTAEYVGSPIAGIGAVGTPQTAAVNVTSSSSTAMPVTGSEATSATHYFIIHAIATAGAGASNTRLRLTMSAGTATPLINSYFKVRRLPAANTGAFAN